MSDLYREHILDHYRNPRNHGTLDPNDDDETRWGKITNPTVHIGLNQLRRLLNAIIRVCGSACKKDPVSGVIGV